MLRFRIAVRERAMAAPSRSAPVFALLARRELLPDEIARSLSEKIASGALAPGDRLPTEAALAESFGVSRNVVREAIARLKYDGVIETRQGLGAFVAAGSAGRSFRIAPGRLTERDDLRQLFELRLYVEMGAAALAARRRTRAQLARIRRALSAMRRAVETDRDGVVPDSEFHHAIADAANNVYYRDFMVFLAERMRQSIAVARSNTAKLRASPGVQKEHEAISAAIEAADAEAAGAAVRAHLVNAAARLGLSLAPEGKTR
jgi:GntR family transcriptional regulator, transcriptional repressor for pyruvate dehydrogenase complex